MKSKILAEIKGPEIKRLTPILTGGVYKGDSMYATGHVPDPEDKIGGALMSTHIVYIVYMQVHIHYVVHKHDSE